MEPHDKKVFATLFFSIFATVTGVGIVVPLLPVYVHSLGAGGLAIGMIFGSFSISRTLFLPFFGRLSDRKGRKPLILPGLFAYALISIAFIFSSSVGALIVIRFFQGIASAALMPVIQAYVGDITPAGQEGATMGLFNLSMFCGLSLGPFLGGAIHDRFGMQMSFVCMGVLGLVGFLLALAFLPPTGTERIVRSAKPAGPWKALVCDRDMLSLFTYRFAYTFGIGIIWSFLPVLADSELDLSSSSIGTLIMVGVLVSGVVQAPMGAVSDRTGKRGLVLAGGLIVAASLFAFKWVDSFGGLVLVNVIFGLGGGISMPALMAMAVSHGTRMNAMGSVMAILTVAHSSGMLAGALIAGLMMDWFSLRLVFPVGGGVALACTLVFVLGTSHRGRPAAR